MKTVQDLAELGYVCGLDTLGEALTCVELHWDAWPPGTLEALYQETAAASGCEIASDTLCVHVLGEERCRALDAELDAHFDAQMKEGPRGDVGFP